MNAVLGFAGAAEQLQRYDAVRRKNAENAYERQTEFREQAQKTKEDLIALLRGNSESVEREADAKKDLTRLDGGLVKNIPIPLGNNLDETIELWREVRREAYSETPPTTADYQLAGKASAKISEAELQLALHNRAKTIREQLAAIGGKTAGATEGPTRMQLQYSHAFTIYQVQNQAKMNQYQIDQPRMNVSV
ncbi:hypothetical protein SporoP37_11560 [Sporosarcina sp. P37]|uniref:hypothetical protein n=1 Tax=unclassified Sporosarcina TaxID=2647733 RepID=UPI0009BFA7E4|nr:MULTISPECIES: hypothetical protein [unclassified Sporosarcina]ARD48722.1 hypothetical protein SporoP33_11145 [Sporosarcina sp. P33]ARK25230.1 hypothetical protein SporoP37_11560 [Sporosarcina sp. P37]PID17162.1 hypothetical protein CSV62_14930 [Sporosarcina sp. P35]